MLLGSYPVYLIVDAQQIAEQQDDWLPTKAIVTESRNERVTGGYSDSTKCHFRYEYVVVGELFNSSLFEAVGGSCLGTRFFEKDDVIQAYYNPADPNFAVVVRRPISLSSVLLPIVVAVMLGGLGLLILIDVINSIRNS